MIELQFRSDHEQQIIEQQQLRKLAPLHHQKPNSQIVHLMEFQHGSSTHSLWKQPKSSYPDASSEITHSFNKKKNYGDFSCELGLAISDNPRRVCRICHRHFSSGRALGGHMRVHGPLFQPAGSKRKLNSTEWKDSEERGSMEVLNLEHGDLSVLSKSVSDKGAGKAEDDVMSLFPESEGEAVEDAQATKANAHRKDIIKESDDEDGSGGYDGFTEVVDNEHLYSSKKSPLYELRLNPKRSRRFADNDFAMELFLSGQGKESSFSSLERPRVCSECGKAFWSWKALFGHMRCHPEREWRGILPPDDIYSHEGQRFRETKRFPKSSYTESSEHELESDVEDRDTYAEGDGEELAPYVIRDEEVNEKAWRTVEEEEVAKEELVVMPREIGTGEEFCGELATAGENVWNTRWPTAAKRSRRKSTEGKAESLQLGNPCPDEAEPELTSESTSSEELGEETPTETPNFLFMLAEAARKIEQDTQVRTSLLQLCPEKDYDSTKYVKGPEGEVGTHEGEGISALGGKRSVVGAGGMYECCTCKKSFHSHQALGGHRASHRKMKGCFARTTVGDDILSFGASDRLIIANNDDTWQYEVLETDQKQRQQLKKGHECSVCHRMFSTGQALGGHKRCHYSGEKVAEAASVTSSNKQPRFEEGHTNSSTLDLNMPAAHDEEGEVACASMELRLFPDIVDDDERERTSNPRASCTTKDAVGGALKASSWKLETKWALAPPFHVPCSLQT